MRNSVQALAPVLRNTAQGDILALLYLNPDDESSIGTITSYANSSLSFVHAELARLLAGEVALERKVGRSRLIRANPEYELFVPLSEIVLATYGPRAVIAEELRDVVGVEEAFIFGSWAARYHGEPGPPPHDVDVVVVGTASRRQLNDVGDRARLRVGREVNFTRMRRELWESQTDLFVQTLHERPLVRVRRSMEPRKIG